VIYLSPRQINLILPAALAPGAAMRIPTKSNSIPEGSRTPFRDEAEHHSGMIPNTHRSVATLPL
jgi:hypothetical protein